MNDVELVVKVEHRNGRHFARCAARTGRSGRIGLLDDVRVRIFLQEDVRALARTIVGFVFLRRYDPIPTEFDEINRQRIATTARLRRRLVAVEADRPLRPVLPSVGRDHLNKRYLNQRSGWTERLEQNKTNCPHSPAILRPSLNR